MFTSLLVGLGLWLIIFLMGSFIGNIVSRKVGSRVVTGAIVQACFIVFSTMVIFFLSEGNYSKYGLRLDVDYLLVSLVTSMLAAFMYALVSYYFTRGEVYEPLFAPKDLFSAVLVMFMLAPLGEEILFRGL